MTGGDESEMSVTRFFTMCCMAVVVLGAVSVASARDIAEVYPLAGGETEIRFDNSCRVLYGSDNRMASVNQYCTASQVNAAIEAANLYFSEGFGSGTDVSTVTCESREGRRAYCSTSTSGGVRLVRQLSSSPCVEGRDWDHDDRGIWVDNGCRAVFEVRSGAALPISTLTCESRYGRRESCRADTSGGVRLSRRLSSAACEPGRGWGYDQTGIWVDNGCRAVFELRPGFSQPVATVTCESRYGRKSSCRAETAGGVRLARKLSSAACDPGRDWGYDNTSIWVDNGCRAVFEVGAAW